MVVTNKLLLLSGSLLYVLYYSYWEIIPKYFADLLHLQGIFTLLFWRDPVKNRNTEIHHIDAIITKIHIVSYIFYKLFIYRKNGLVFSITTSTGLYFFYLSHRYSTREWCSRPHLLCHFGAHIFSALSIYLAIL